MGPRSLISLHSMGCPGFISRISGLTSSVNWILIRACRSQQLEAAAATIGFPGPAALCQTFRQWKHSSVYDRLEMVSAFVCSEPWRCSDVKLYSCRCWTHPAVCPSRCLKLISQVKAELLRKWNYCSYRYFRKCSVVFTTLDRSHNISSWIECCSSRLQPVPFHFALGIVHYQSPCCWHQCRRWTSPLVMGSPGQVCTVPLSAIGKRSLFLWTTRMSALFSQSDQRF